MSRLIDVVMLHSERIDERSRLIARVADNLRPAVDVAAPHLDEAARAALLRRAVISAVRERPASPLDLVAAALDRIARGADSRSPWGLPIAAGPALAIGLVDGRDADPDDLADVLGVTADQVRMGHELARAALHLPEVAHKCLRGDLSEPRHVRRCSDCLIATADRAVAHARLERHGAIPTGPIADLLVAETAARRRVIVLPDAYEDARSPEPWSALVGAH